MSEQLNRRSLFEMARFILSWIDYLCSQEKARIETITSWIVSLAAFDSKALAALNSEELNSIEEEKQIFLNEIGYDENILRSMQRLAIEFEPMVVKQTTEERLRFVFEEMACRFYLQNPNFRIDVFQTALDKYILEKQKYTATVASVASVA